LAFAEIRDAFAICADLVLAALDICAWISLTFASSADLLGIAEHSGAAIGALARFAKL
jgi:hypothetical protein